jgi:hypothetical protein
VAPVFGAWPAWPAPSDGGVGQRWGAGSPGWLGAAPDSPADVELAEPDDDGDCPPDVDGCPPADDCCPPADGLPDDGLPDDGLPDDPEGGDALGGWDVGTVTLGVAQPPTPSAADATSPIHARFCRQIKKFSNCATSLAPVPDAPPLTCFDSPRWTGFNGSRRPPAMQRPARRRPGPPRPGKNAAARPGDYTPCAALA